jgi:hypothetical protein
MFYSENSKAKAHRGEGGAVGSISSELIVKK